jgi:hypothetical protein
VNALFFLYFFQTAFTVFLAELAIRFHPPFPHVLKPHTRHKLWITIIASGSAVFL